MDFKVIYLPAFLLMAYAPTASSCSDDVCSMQGPLTEAHCTTTYFLSTQQVRACCLYGDIIGLCNPVTTCTDFVDLSALSNHYDLPQIAGLTDMSCDCDVITCWDSEEATCIACP